MSEQVFSALYGLVPEKGSLRMTIKKLEDGRMVVAVLPELADSKVVIAGSSAHDKTEEVVRLDPLILTGTSAELDAGFIETVKGYAAVSNEFVTNVESMQARMQAKFASLKAKEDAKNAKSGNKAAKCVAPAPTPLDRKDGELDEEQLELLVSGSDDEGFKDALHAANEATLTEALAADDLSLSDLRVIGAELKKVTGAESVEPVVGALSVLYKKSGQAERVAIGKEIGKISGKTPADLGLEPKQTSLLGDLGFGTGNGAPATA
ncbi:MAG: PRTRC system protein E [Proteobacteria bacterium]|nr:PRTRC system protein E [Pseudomonadota bacterium]